MAITRGTTPTIPTTSSTVEAAAPAALRPSPGRSSAVLFVLAAALGVLLPGLGSAVPAADVPTAAAAGFTGMVRSEIRPDAAATAAAATPAAVAAETKRSCRDRAAYALENWRVADTYRWTYNAGGAPRSVAARSVPAISNATATVARGTNGCGTRVSLTTSQSYRGKSSRKAQLTPAGGCTGTDGDSVTSWMRMTSSALAVTCTFYSKGKVVESDVAINTKYSWFTSVPRACRNAYDLQSVMTHERGHTFGLGHVSPSSHGGQTMTTTVPPCNTTKRTLGGGDLAGLMRKYGR